GLGFVAAPGWLVWYIILVLVRRRNIAVNLDNAKSIIVDPATSRVAVHAPIEGRDRWFALQLASDFEPVSKTLNAAFLQKVSQGTVANPSILPIVLLITLILAAFGAIVLFVVQNAY